MTSLRRLSPILYLLPLVLPLLVDNQYYIHGIFCRVIIYTILVASLDIVVGYIGDISIGHAGLFAIGAYSVAILSGPKSLNTEGTMAFMPEISFFAALAVGVALAALAGLVLGFPSLRSSGPYLAVSTIAYGLIISTFINEQEFLTNGTKGIHVAAVRVLGTPLSGNRFLWLVYPFLLAVMWIMRNLGKSYWGRAFEAIKYSAIAAEACGIWRSRYKIIGFVLSAAIAGLAGGLFTQLDQYVAASTFNLDFSILMLIALIFGGLRSPWGNFIGIALVVILPDQFTAFKDYRLLVFGVLLLLTLFFLPNGVSGLIASLWRELGQRFLNDSSSHGEALRAELESQAKNDPEPLFQTSSSEQVSAVNSSESVAPKNSTEKSPQKSADALDVIDVRMQFGGLVAVNNLSFKIKPGTVMGLMGPNGSGKSTTVNLITGLYLPVGGQIKFFAQDITSSKPFARAKAGIARTFQNLQLFSEMSVLDHVLVGQHLLYRSNLFAVLLGLPAVAREEHKMQARAYRWLKFVGLEKLAFEKAKNLAYGQARRLEMARALAQNPRFLLLDEPAAGLTSGEIEEFNEIILKVKNQGIAILLIEHHMDMLLKVSDHITVLDFGKKIAEGTPESVQNNPAVIEAYLGAPQVAAGAQR